MRDPRYDPLFEPIRIGPVTAKNRFFQVPHCNGMGHAMPLAHAAMREVKAEGGWAVVSTEECEIHPSTDLTPYVEARLWDDRDIPALALMCEKVHAHGALAAVELTHNGPAASNLFSREVLLAPSHQPTKYGYPHQARAMDKADIRDYRRWHREAAVRGMQAGMDIVYVYAAHDLSLAMHFLQRRRNQRTDEYGGSLENRVRLLRELLEDTRDAVGHRCGVALRFATEEMLGPGGVELAEARDIVGLLAELPDLWDVNVSAWHNDSLPSRFGAEGAQEPFIDFVKKTTSKPVVGVGRFTSPDTMVSQLRRGVIDIIGAARPSIADPFLPRKIEEGRIDDIRECIGCNVCVSGDNTVSPIRCTQNPSMGEEWRKGWHPERIAPARKPSKVLVVGAGPAGLEAARALGQRGFEVSLAEASRQLGGRVSREARLPGLAEWARVRDWRVGQINKMANVATYLDSRLEAADVLAFGAEHVVIATGARWRRDGFGRSHGLGIEGFADNPAVFTPDDLMDGRLPEGDVVVFDDDGGYHATVLAELLAKAGCRVHFVTPEDVVAPWGQYTLEYRHVRKRLAALGVSVHVSRMVAGYSGRRLRLQDAWSEATFELGADGVVSVTSRLPDERLFLSLREREADWKDAGLVSAHRIGDCDAPGLIAHAVYAGHALAQGLGEAAADTVPFRRHFHHALGP
ncbi:FAD-dependent oxidoreductase [Arenimonas donghaensis]|uniref:Methylamine n=1 Tax=Arenimonas donghaensis DSM 18148 = HO3-R19 TaxID=1121014 RepID=A0A087MK51_9GAMM|nr:FAD-dependent oxidoreductase [Arenimonas donghaensis]KFL37254.1 methylamine [Arenimonas donghaensis DSM 18148 = HO3-R19]